MTQTFNPLRFHCAPNQATPDYIIYDDFRSFVAYGLMVCWLSHTADDPNADCNMARPVTRDDVEELRKYFLDLLETVVVALWKEQYKPGDGDIDGNWQSVIIAKNGDESGQDETMLTWYVSLRDDAIMLEMSCTGSDPSTIWLSYDALKDRQNVLKVIADASATVPSHKLWDDLIEEAAKVTDTN